jgi:hypothetical protein
MTGGQEAPDLVKLLKMLVSVRRLDLSATEVEMEQLLREELARQGASAVVAEGRCTMHQNKKHS